MATKPFIRHSGKFLMIAFLVYPFVMAVDLIAYGVNSPDLLGRFLWHIPFVFLYTHIYNQAAKRWRFSEEKGKRTFGKYIGGIAFSVLAGLLFIVAIAMSQYMISVLYIFLLDGIHGPPPEAVIDDGILIAKTVAAGLVIEFCGREESDMERN